MYSLLTSQSGLPIVVNRNSIEYPHLIMSGYEEQLTGHKKDLQEKEREILEELYMTNDYLIN